jgi:hypothetical protein
MTGGEFEVGGANVDRAAPAGVHLLLSACWRSAPDHVDLANRVKAHEDARPAKERIHIGGHLVMTCLRPRERPRGSWPKFDDHINTWQRMNNASGIDARI